MDNRIHRFVFTGRVVESLNDSGSKKIKLLLNPEYIELGVDPMTEIHLGDEVMIMGKVIIENAAPVVRRNKDDTEK
ncbi:MAG: hypothetical protein PVH88_25930 [Ignavibacteria bacterium]|jgi:hypothetical protein